MRDQTRNSTRHQITLAVLAAYLGSRKTAVVSGSGRLMTMLAEYDRCSVRGGSEPTGTDWSEVPRPYGPSVLSRHGVTGKEVRDQFEERILRDPADPGLDEEFVVELFPKPYWEVVANLITDGPKIAARRFELALKIQAKRTVPATTARPNGGVLSQGTLEKLFDEMSRLIAEILNVRKRTDLAGLEAWEHRPVLKVPLSQPSEVTDTSPPSLRLLRETLRRLDQEIEDAFKCGVAQQAEHVRQNGLKTSQTYLFRKLRIRAWLALLACVGMRVDALTRLKVSSIERLRPRHDGQPGPAIALLPQKTMGDEEISWKPIPAELMHRIDAYLAFVEARVGHQLPGDNPLIITSLKNYKAPITAKAIRAVLGQRTIRRTKMPDGKVREVVTPPLMPRPNSEAGYSPHTLRSAVMQMITSKAGADWFEKNRDEWDDWRLAAGDIALPMIGEVLLDHAVKSDPLGYGGASKDRDRERLAGYGTAITWALLTTDAGARKIPDAEGFRVALHQRSAAEGELERIDRLTDEAFANTKEPAQALMQVQELKRRERVVREQLMEIKERLEALRNADNFVAVPDDEEEIPDVDLDQIEEDVLGGGTAYERRRFKSIRDWVTPKELSMICGVGEATVRRWLQGHFPTHVQPWDPANPPVDDSHGPKRRQLRVAGLNPALWNSELKKEKLEETLARWPEGWSRAAIEGSEAA